ncbi:MAG: hypothetical protein PHQ65_02110 [Bacteroidales bacterium]|nr:hypothetical protein [Bacteroidales bacterium]MDD3664034.1 hypothetical protein [Bacteroidales bacterium]
MQRKPIIAWFLLALLAAPLVVVVVGYQQTRYAVRKAVKQQMIAGMDRSRLTMLVLAKTDAEGLLRWEHSREFEYKGAMYDVVEASSDSDSVRYLCWPDHHETRLNRQLRHLVNLAMGSNPRSQREHTRLFDFLSKLFPAGYSTASPASPSACLVSFASPEKNFSSRNPETDLPPPRLV